jgi:hypothetical protein
MSYIDRLIANCELAKKANPVNEFELNDLSELADIQQAIYVIEQIDSDIDKVFLDFSRYKNKKRKKMCKAKLAVKNYVCWFFNNRCAKTNKATSRPI